MQDVHEPFDTVGRQIVGAGIQGVKLLADRRERLVFREFHDCPDDQVFDNALPLFCQGINLGHELIQQRSLADVVHQRQNIVVVATACREGFADEYPVPVVGGLDQNRLGQVAVALGRNLNVEEAGREAVNHVRNIEYQVDGFLDHERVKLAGQVEVCQQHDMRYTFRWRIVDVVLHVTRRTDHETLPRHGQVIQAGQDNVRRVAANAVDSQQQRLLVIAGNHHVRFLAPAPGGIVELRKCLALEVHGTDLYRKSPSVEKSASSPSSREKPPSFTTVRFKAPLCSVIAERGETTKMFGMHSCSVGRKTLL